MIHIDIAQLKEYIVENDKTSFVLEKLNCHSIKEHTKEYRCGLDGDTSKTRVAVHKTTLSIKIFQSDDKIVRGDIITLTMHIKNLTFPQANKWLHNVLDLEYRFDIKKYKEDKNKDHPLDIFRKVKKRRNVCNVDDLETFGEETLNEFVPHPHIDWIRVDGIMPWTCEEFGIGYAPNKKRIVIPHRLWCGGRNDYVGIIGRTTIAEYSMLDIPKYFPLKAYPKGMNLYGLNENYKYIQESGFVVVGEAEKSTLKRHSRNDKTCVAACSHDLSDEQVRILISLNVDVVIAWDKDVSLQHIRATCNRFYGIRNVYYMYDKWDLLGKKDSPADLPNKLYNFMFKYKVKYDESEHREYLKGLKQ